MHRRRRDVGREARGACLRGFIKQHDRRAAGRDGGKLFIGNQEARAGIADDVADFIGGRAEN